MINNHPLFPRRLDYARIAAEIEAEVDAELEREDKMMNIYVAVSGRNPQTCAFQMGQGIILANNINDAWLMAHEVWRKSGIFDEPAEYWIDGPHLYDRGNLTQANLTHVLYNIAPDFSTQYVFLAGANSSMLDLAFHTKGELSDLIDSFDHDNVFLFDPQELRNKSLDPCARLTAADFDYVPLDGEAWTPFDTVVSRWRYPRYFGKDHVKIARWLEQGRPYTFYQDGQFVSFKDSTMFYATWLLDELWSEGIINDFNRITANGLVWLLLNS